MALFTGLRRNEIFHLTWDRVCLDGRFFWIDKTKNGDPLELPITTTLMNIFIRRQSMNTNQSVFVFPGRTPDKPIHEPRRVIENISIATAIDGSEPIEFTCHDIRRTFATVAELSNIGSYALKRLLNHKTLRSPDVTQGYIHLGADELKEPASIVESAILDATCRSCSTESLHDEIIGMMSSLSEDGKLKIKEMMTSLLKEII